MSEFLDIPFATCAGIGDGHDGRAFAMLELRELLVAPAATAAVVDKGRSKEEHR